MIVSCLGGFTAMADADMVNVAIYQLAKASTVIDVNHDASLANDGINDNADYTYWMSGKGDKAPYWQVDLGLPYKINKIELEARKGGEADERKNIRILASETDDFSAPIELGSAGDEDYGEMLTIDVTKKARYRYIRVEKTDAKPLSIGEIRILTEKSAILQGMDAVNLTDQIPASDEAGRYVVPADVIGTPYEEVVTLLGALNLMRGYPDGDFLPYEPISRAEFTAVAMRLLNYNMSASTKSFMDVTTDHWAYNEIESAASLGIVNGVGEGLFKPDDVVTTTQVLKILCCVMGYGETAEMMGGYPNGYWTIAQKIGLIKGVSIADGENITRGEIAMLVNNALECDIMVLTSFGENVGGTAVKGETLLTEYLGIYKAEGVVTGAGNSALTSVVDELETNKVEIDGISYNTEIPGVDKYLGYMVDYYYEEDASSANDTVVAIIVQGSNNVTVIDAENLIRIDGNKLIYVTDDEKEKNLTLASDMDLVYNGVARTVYDKNTDLLPETGSVTLIDNDGNRSIDVYIVNKIDNYVVNWVNANDKQIYVKNGSKVLNLDNEENVVTITHKSTGKSMALTEIKEWNILSVMESVNSSGVKQYRVIVSDDVVRGELEEISDDEVIVAGRSFKVASSFDITELELGAKGIFYIDAEGKLAAFNGDINPGEQYGFLRAFGSQRENMKDRLVLRIFTKEGVFKTLYATDSFEINGKPCTTETAARSTLLATGMNGTEAQAIRFTVTGKGEVSDIVTTAGDLSKDYDAQAKTPASLSSGKGYYYTSSGTFDSRFSLNTDTVIIKLPTSDLDTEKDYSVMSSGGIRTGNYYWAQAYDTGEERIAKMIIFTGGVSGGASSSTTFFLVDRLSRAQNEDGEVLYKVSGLYTGAMRSYFIDEDVVVNPDDFKQGTVLTLAFAGSTITDYEVKLFEGEKPEGAPNASVSTHTPQYGANIQGLMGTCWYGYGTVETKKNGIIRISFENVDIPNPGSSTQFTNYPELVANISSFSRIYRYDSENKKISVANSTYVLDRATVGDAEASKVLIRADSGNTVEMVIFD